MSLYAIAGPRLIDCLLARLTDAVNRNEVIYTTESSSKMFYDFTPVFTIATLGQMTQDLANRYSKRLERISIFLPNLSYDDIELSEFLEVASTSEKSCADVYIGMSDCSLISLLEQKDVIRINAGEIELCTWQYYKYPTRREHNNAIYDYIMRRKENDIK